MVAAAGGVNVSMPVSEVGTAINNPALLAPVQHTLVGASFNAFFKGTKAYTLTGVYHSNAWNTTFGGQIFFLDYGSVPATNASGVEEGTFRPTDFFLQFSASRRYTEKWHYGINVKFAASDYGSYQSTALMGDVGLLYNDTVHLIRVGLVAKNMGTQLRVYNTAEDLPFDLQVGLTKKLAKAPFGFSLTAQQIHQFNTVYQDTAYNNELQMDNSNAGFGTKLFNHLVGAVHFYVGDKLELTAGYNRLRRFELNNGASGNGLNGFSAGMHASLKKIGVSYGRAWYGRSFAYNQLSVQLKLAQINVFKDL